MGTIISSFKMMFAGALLSVGVAGYFYYINTQAELERLRSEIDLYEVKFAKQNDVINELQVEVKAQAERLNTLSVANQQAESELNRYLDIFRRHNLTRLAAAKPDWVTNIVNNGTKDVFDSIEDVSRIIDDLDGDGVQLAPAGKRDSDTDSTSESTDSSTDPAS